MALSPLNQRRWRNFKANRRAFWSLWILACVIGLRAAPALAPIFAKDAAHAR
mgnify:CR=1 FL=1